MLPPDPVRLADPNGGALFAVITPFTVNAPVTFSRTAPPPEFPPLLPPPLPMLVGVITEP